MGTGNQVTLVAYGDKGHTEQLTLQPREPGEPTFRPGNTDEFKLNLGEDIGRLYKIRVGHESANTDDGWYLEEVS